MTAPTIVEAEQLVRAAALAEYTVHQYPKPLPGVEGSFASALACYVDAVNAARREDLGEVGAARPWALGDRLIHDGKCGTVVKNPSGFGNGNVVDDDGDLRVRFDDDDEYGGEYVPVRQAERIE